jgi:hypothetical protein
MTVETTVRSQLPATVSEGDRWSQSGGHGDHPEHLTKPAVRVFSPVGVFIPSTATG